MIRIIKSICQPPLCLIWFAMPFFNVAAAEVDIGMENSIKSLEPETMKYIKKIAREASDSKKSYVYVSSVVRGDIDGDKQKDVFVSFAVEGIGGGNFSMLYQALFVKKTKGYILAAERSNCSTGTASGSCFVPASMSRGKILGEILEYAESDGACCPSIKRKTTLLLRNGKLVEEKVKKQ